MSHRHRFLATLSLVFVSFFVALGGSRAQTPTKIPIEVMGNAGTIVTTRVHIPAKTDLTGYRQFWLKIHGLTYQNKASVRINSGSWIDLNNTTAKVIGAGAKYGGIGGTYATLKLTIPLTGKSLPVIDTNLIQFRFDGTDGVSNQFRVLGFNFQDQKERMLLPPSTFINENCNAWTPPLSDNINISTGKRLWQTALLRKSPLQTGLVIGAKCMDCHARDGRDLKYFNYSNASIISRSRFHGLTTLQGTQIASYIRTLPFPNPGQPWNPPYQPGPGLDALPVSSWAAGAGVDWALDDDAQAWTYLFPEGGSSENIATYGNLNTRETPVAMQFPDWNHWLPKIHPKDAWGTAFTSNNLLKKFNGEGTGTAPWNFIAKLRASNANKYVLERQFREDLGYWGNDAYQLLLAFTMGTDIVWTPEHSEKVYGTRLWQLVKEWELMQEFGLEDRGKQVYGNNGETRTWFTSTAFRVSPFMLRIPSDANGIGGSALTNQYFSNVWYQVQLTLNNSNRQPVESFPVDWPYVRGKLKDLYWTSLNAEPARLTYWIIKSMQETDNGIGPEKATTGWCPSVTGDVSGLVHWSILPTWSDVPANLRAGAMTAVLRTWLAKTKQYPVTSYYAAGTASADYVPRSWYDGNFGDKVLYMIPEFDRFGVSVDLLNETIDWAKTVWPRGNWESLRPVRTQH